MANDSIQMFRTKVMRTYDKCGAQQAVQLVYEQFGDDLIDQLSSDDFALESDMVEQLRQALAIESRSIQVNGLDSDTVHNLHVITDNLTKIEQNPSGLVYEMNDIEPIAWKMFLEVVDEVINRPRLYEIKNR